MYLAEYVMDAGLTLRRCAAVPANPATVTLSTLG